MQQSHGPLLSSSSVSLQWLTLCCVTMVLATVVAFVVARFRCSNIRSVEKSLGSRRFPVQPGNANFPPCSTPVQAIADPPDTQPALPDDAPGQQQQHGALDPKLLAMYFDPDFPGRAAPFVRDEPEDQQRLASALLGLIRSLQILHHMYSIPETTAYEFSTLTARGTAQHISTELGKSAPQTRDGFAALEPSQAPAESSTVDAADATSQPVHTDHSHGSMLATSAAPILPLAQAVVRAVLQISRGSPPQMALPLCPVFSPPADAPSTTNSNLPQALPSLDAIRGASPAADTHLLMQPASSPAAHGSSTAISHEAAGLPTATVTAAYPVISGAGLLTPRSSISGFPSEGLSTNCSGQLEFVWLVPPGFRTSTSQPMTSPACVADPLPRISAPSPAASPTPSPGPKASGLYTRFNAEATAAAAPAQAIPFSSSVWQRSSEQLAVVIPRPSGFMPGQLSPISTIDAESRLVPCHSHPVVTSNAQMHMIGGDSLRPINEQSELPVLPEMGLSAPSLSHSTASRNEDPFPASSPDCAGGTNNSPMPLGTVTAPLPTSMGAITPTNTSSSRGHDTGSTHASGMTPLRAISHAGGSTCTVQLPAPFVPRPHTQPGHSASPSRGGVGPSGTTDVRVSSSGGSAAGTQPLPEVGAGRAMRWSAGTSSEGLSRMSSSVGDESEDRESVQGPANGMWQAWRSMMDDTPEEKAEKTRKVLAGLPRIPSYVYLTPEQGEGSFLLGLAPEADAFDNVTWGQPRVLSELSREAEETLSRVGGFRSTLWAMDMQSEPRLDMGPAHVNAVPEVKSDSHVQLHVTLGTTIPTPQQLLEMPIPDPRAENMEVMVFAGPAVAQDTMPAVVEHTGAAADMVADPAEPLVVRGLTSAMSAEQDVVSNTSSSASAAVMFSPAAIPDTLSQSKGAKEQPLASANAVEPAPAADAVRLPSAVHSADSHSTVPKVAPATAAPSSVPVDAGQPVSVAAAVIASVGVQASLGHGSREASYTNAGRRPSMWWQPAESEAVLLHELAVWMARATQAEQGARAAARAAEGALQQMALLEEAVAEAHEKEVMLQESLHAAQSRSQQLNHVLKSSGAALVSSTKQVITWSHSLNLTATTLKGAHRRHRLHVKKGTTSSKPRTHVFKTMVKHGLVIAKLGHMRRLRHVLHGWQVAAMATVQMCSQAAVVQHTPLGSGMRLSGGSAQCPAT